ncbi:leucine-rich repeat protein [Hepatocystis sp. ex Piliocolobus tephrosceles]|nr:leucine-rich repeat protein [Hepatocystis sp. ex Piliocolobus tephrosceles]
MSNEIDKNSINSKTDNNVANDSEKNYNNGITNGDNTNENVTNGNVTNENVTNGNVTNENVTNGNVTNEDVTNSENLNKASFNLKDGLSRIERTLKGDGYAFSDLLCVDKNLNSIPEEIVKYTHLKYINMAHNKIKNITILYELNYIICLDLSYNSIEKLEKLEKIYLKNCLYMNISHNLIKIVEDIMIKNIIELDLSYNTIEEINIYLSATLKILILSNNNIKNLNFKNNLPNLVLLDISSNPIENLNFYDLTPNINELKINDNSTIPIEQLSNLNHFKYLKSLEMKKFDSFKDMSYDEIKEMLLKNTQQIKLSQFNGQAFGDG